jgi:hypothetical protein
MGNSIAYVLILQRKYSGIVSIYERVGLGKLWGPVQIVTIWQIRTVTIE